MLVEELRLSNLLSFASNPVPLVLGSPNLVIGPNGSGKSNLLEPIDLLRTAPDQLAKPIREGGGIRDWLWKGEKGTATACIDATLANPKNPLFERAVGRLAGNIDNNFSARSALRLFCAAHRTHVGAPL